MSKGLFVRERELEKKKSDPSFFDRLWGAESLIYVVYEVTRRSYFLYRSSVVEESRLNLYFKHYKPFKIETKI